MFKKWRFTAAINGQKPFRATIQLGDLRLKETNLIRKLNEEQKKVLHIFFSPFSVQR